MVCCLANLSFFDIPLSYYYNIILLYLFLHLPLSNPISSVSFVTFSELLYGEVLNIFLILRATLLQVKSPVASAIFSVPFLKYF